MTQATVHSPKLKTARKPDFTYGRGTFNYSTHTPYYLDSRDCQEFGLPVQMVFNREMNDKYND